MKSLLAIVLPLLGLASSSLAEGGSAYLWGESGGRLERRVIPAVTPRDSPLSRLENRQTCTNGPTSRNCWSDGFDINTNWYNSWPDTGRTVTVSQLNQPQAWNHADGLTFLV